MPNFLAFFHQRNAAEAELAWLLENADKAPDAGWLREIYYHLGKLALAEGEQAKAQDYLRRSGYKEFARPITLITPFRRKSHPDTLFAPRRISEIVPGRVYALSGFEFTEYYFVVSDDRQELIGHRCRYTPGRCQSRPTRHCERMRLTCRN